MLKRFGLGWGVPRCSDRSRDARRGARRKRFHPLTAPARRDRCKTVGTKGARQFDAASGGSNQGLLRRCTRMVFRWPSASTRRIGDGLRAHGFRNEVGVLAQTVTGALDMHDDGVVKKSVEQRGRDHGIPPKTSPHSAKPRFEVSIIAPFS